MRTACFLTKGEQRADGQRDPERHPGCPGSTVPECEIEREQGESRSRMCPGEASCRLEAEWSCIEKRDVRPLASEILQIPGARYVRHLLQAADQTAAKRDRDEHIRRGPTRGARTRREETCCERAKQRQDDQQDRVASVAVQQYVCPPVSPADPDLQRIVVGPGVREV